LVSERTVEENILKKANQKRILGDIAIEGGNFTTAFFKKQTIHDLFTAGGGAEETAAVGGVDDDEEPALPTTAKKSIGAFESALATAEDDSDRQATSIARAEEENLDEADFNEQPEEEDGFAAVLAELSSVERYALRQMRAQEEEWAAAQLQLAEAEIQARKEEFDADKLDELTQEIRAEMGDDEEETSSDNDNDSDDDDDNDDSDSDDGDPEEEGDYVPEGSGTDDEETIGQDEKEVDDKAGNNPAHEIHMLENEAEVPIEELLRMYYPDQLKNMLEIEVDMEEAPASAAPGAEAVKGEEEGGERKKTRSRGTVEINLWNLGTKKQ
jgi:hypothetical protein